MAIVKQATRDPIDRWLMRYGFGASVLLHVVLFAAALFMAFAIYFNATFFEGWLRPFWLPMLPIVVGIKMVVFWKMNLFRRGWRYFGMRDLWSVFKAAIISTSGFIAVTWGLNYYYRYRFTAFPQQPYFLFHYVFDESGQPVKDAAGNDQRFQFPQSVYGLDLGMTIALVCGVRILVRLYHEETRPVARGGVKRCLIIGAGDAGEALLRELRRMPVQQYQVVGFLDDDVAKRGLEIHGVPVLGVVDQVREMCEEKRITEVLIALPRVPHKELRKIVERCEGTNVRFQTIPPLEDMIAGRLKVTQVRDVQINDLLGRDPVVLDEQGLQAFLRGKRVLVTGAGGSIGSEICRQVAGFKPARLILVEQAENNLFEIDREIGALAPDVPRLCRIADICDHARVERVFREVKPEVVFHAAAHKHVPMMEWNVGEAVKNNIVGTRTIADASKRHGVGRFVMISTDKAVNPTSVMGCTKRVAEMYIQQLRQGSNTHFMTVRFGNVLGSSGSVVPIFAKQIAAGGPVTVTDPKMTRYFMTIPEATQLVLQAGVIGNDGDIFVLDMGEPVKIVDLAREMITLSGLRPGEDIEIVYSGVRPGEKLFEELSVKGEDMAPTQHQQIYIWRNRVEDWQAVCRAMDELAAKADTAGDDEMRTMLMRIVPEYAPDTTAANRNPPSAVNAASSDNGPAGEWNGLSGNMVERLADRGRDGAGIRRL